jgi:AcrR family transcriptional regulator
MTERESESQSKSDVPRQRIPRAEREQQILDVAKSIFAERGFHATTMDEIAEAVGVSKQMVYNYAGSKEELYAAVFHRAAEELERRIDSAASESAEPDVQLWRGILAFFSFVEEQREAWLVIYGPLADRGGPFATEFAQVRHLIARLVSGLFAEARAAAGNDPSVDTEPMALAMVAAGEELANWWLEHPTESREAVASRLMNYAWMGLSNLVHDREWHPQEREPRSSR